MLPFEGTIDWKRVMAGLRDIDYQGLFNLEVGGALHNVPLGLREKKLHYALELTKALLKKIIKYFKGKIKDSKWKYDELVKLRKIKFKGRKGW